MMTTAEMVAILKSLHALDHAAATIARQTDLTETFTWQEVLTSIRDRQTKLLNQAADALNEPVNSATNLGHAVHVPPGRVH